jgi:hypothetical protein
MKISSNNFKDLPDKLEIVKLVLLMGDIDKLRWDTGWGAIYVPSFIKIGSGIQKLLDKIPFSKTEEAKQL